VVAASSATPANAAEIVSGLLKWRMALSTSRAG
jgi:hypothetical protein